MHRERHRPRITRSSRAIGLGFRGVDHSPIVLRVNLVARVNQPRVLAVFGGAFDPPHLGHTLLPGYLRAIADVDRLLVAPCADHPLGKSMHPFASRLAWCRIAMAGFGPWVEVTAIERELAAAQPGPSYTLRLLEAVADRHPDMAVRLVVGSDIVRSGETARWHRWDEIERRFAPIVVPRAGWSDGACPLPEVSSTDVRAWMAEGTDAAWGRVADAVPAAVLRMLRAAAPPIWIVGRGHVAAHLEPWLAAKGHPVTILGGHAIVDGTGVLPETPPKAVWIAVRDPVIPAVAQALVGRLPPETIVVHAAGARRSEDVLAPLRAAGHPVGSLHPAASMRGAWVDPRILEGAAFGIEGDPAAVAWARQLVGAAPVIDLGGLDAHRRTAYHAACALVANHLAVITLEAEAVWRSLGADPSARTGFVASLLRSAVTNLLALGVPAGISGPATRGDAAGIAAHQGALPDGAAELYGFLGGKLLALLRAG